MRGHRPGIRRVRRHAPGSCPPAADHADPVSALGEPPGVPAPLVQRALMVWTNLFGVISFELFGQLHNVVAESRADRDAFFAACVHRWITFTAISWDLPPRRHRQRGGSGLCGGSGTPGGPKSSA
jgi:hypothetical protein